MLTLAEELQALMVAVKRYAANVRAAQDQQRLTCRSYKIGAANRDALETLIKRHPRGLSVVEIVEKTGMKKHTICGHLSRMAKEGRIVRSKRHNFYVYKFNHERE